MKTKAFERDGEKITVSTGFDEDGEAAIILVHTHKDGADTTFTLTLRRASDSDTAFDILTEDNVWGWPRVLGLWG